MQVDAPEVIHQVSQFTVPVSKVHRVWNHLAQNIPLEKLITGLSWHNIQSSQCDAITLGNII
jgi:hypothetical protein